MSQSTAAKYFALDAIIAGTTAAAIKTIMAPVENHRLILYLGMPYFNINIFRSIFDLIDFIQILRPNQS